MKRLILFSLAFVMGVAVMAQRRPVTISKALQNQAYPAPVMIDNQTVFSTSGNPVVNSKAALEEIIGGSRYDMQTNAAIQNNRLTMWPDGSIAATWTMAFADPGYADRGAGYNYFNGTSWGSAPTARLETVRTGWPSVHQYMGNGELVISHNSTVNLVWNSRPVKGTGAWTQSLKPSSPAGAPGILWPRTVTNGDNHQIIHVLALTMPVANGGAPYQNLDGALLYFRSQDGGATWDIPGVILPGMEAPNYLGFSGDSYAWAEPKGNHIAFVIGDDWSDTFLMESFDNGTTWTKKLILENFYKLSSSTAVTPSFYSCDGAVSAAIASDGKVHVAFGRMRAKGDADGKKYYPYTDGVIYWNSTMAAIDSNIYNDIDTLYNHNLLIGYVVSNAAGDTIAGFPKYYMSLSSFPQTVIDNNDNIYFVWSGLTVGNPSPDPYNYRHLWGRAWFHDKAAWEEMKDFNEGVFYMFQEYVYPAAASALKADKLQVIYQTSAQPGANIKDTTIPIHDVNIEHREINSADFAMVGIDNKQATTRRNPVGKNYPNPVRDVTNINLNLDQASNVTIDVMNVTGQKVMTLDNGVMQAGASQITLNASQLTPGIYFYTVKINGESFTNKMIVE